MDARRSLNLRFDLHAASMMSSDKKEERESVADANIELAQAAYPDPEDEKTLGHILDVLTRR